ncbi:MAG TPA: hypothetical protein VI386_24400 [Candidatus Sulfotelmatobacter sp.]
MNTVKTTSATATGMKLARRSDAPHRCPVTFLCCMLLTAVSLWGEPAAALPGTSLLDHGFSGLYNLDFAGAQKDFSAWELQHPEDPVGPVSAAAGYLFSEFNRLGVLESQFYTSDSAFDSRSKLTPDAAVHDQFVSSLGRADRLAHARLDKDPNDHDALFALTLSDGLQADYAALIEKRNLNSLHYTKEASTWAQKLLSICNNCYDVFVATGFSKYIIGSMSAPVRWMLRMGGLPGDKQGGISDLKLTASNGHYLAPFARILLSIAYVREKDKPRALEMLAGLQADFPGNPLFQKEISRLQTSH